MSTSIKGNCRYISETIENAHIGDQGEERARWETTRVIADPDEHDEAMKIRGKARGLIVAQCLPSAFGLLCPESKLDELLAAINEARILVDKFNADARLTRVAFNVIYGRIEQDDVQAVRAISAELRNLMEEMQAGLANLDVKAVRDAAAKARGISGMLAPEAKTRLEVAIVAARESAKKIVKAGEVIGLEIDRDAIEKIDQARVSFLDLEDAREVATPAVDGRNIDLEVS
jgi:hypothetical protein